MSTHPAYSVVSRIDPIDRGRAILIFCADAWIMSIDYRPGGAVHLWANLKPDPLVLGQIMRYCETMGLTVVVH